MVTKSDSPAMTIAVDWDVNQQNKQSSLATVCTLPDAEMQVIIVSHLKIEVK